jgi:pseudouridine-5'-phosphate glycosidase
MSAFIEAALEASTRAGVAGKAVTPFLLEAINRLSGGRSLQTNIALVKNNARLAAEIAIADTARPAEPSR